MTQENNDLAISNLYAIANGLQVIGVTGLHYCRSGFDKERFEKILQASDRLKGILSGKPSVNYSHDFYDISNRQSPVIGVEAAVFRNEEILLIKRSDSGLWAVPGGLADFGETLPEGALRELKEETGLMGKVVRLLGVFDLRLWQSMLNVQTHSLVFEAAATGDPVTTDEATACGFFSADKLPPLTPGHVLRVPLLFKLKAREVPAPFFDITN
jgi:ADP-ribose pyrophosphatase YjhB (NUDIX family)